MQPATEAVDKVPPPYPVVHKVSGRSVRPSITGTWPEGDAAKLTVEIAGKTYELGRDAGLTSNGSGNWVLILDFDLADSTYDVVATATDRAGNSSTDRGFGEVIVDSSAPAVPTVNKLLTRQRQPVITGTWPSAAAERLTVSVASRTYVAGSGDGLDTDGNTWTLRIGEKLADGIYNVSASSVDPSGDTATDATENELVVDATPPDVPTVQNYSSQHPRPLLSGTFPEDDTFTMAVSFDGKTVAMVDSERLSSDGNGNWSLATTRKLQPGRYDVKVVVADKAGNQREDVTVDEIEILAQEESQAVRPGSEGESVSVAQCQALLDEVLAEDQIKFSPGNALILGKSTGLLNGLADVIKQCGNLNIEIGGHTDWQRSGSYNQALSERRANAVRDTLLARGVRADNITAVGYGESKPIADNRTRKGRAANRRTEFRVLNRGN